MQNKTPVLFAVFNRPDTTKKVFAEIRKYKPNKLFIAADGPRKNKQVDIEKCIETRKITEVVDWPCEVKRLYRNKNLGCKLAVSDAISWFFKNVEEGIILEDDCLPDETFFVYCSILLKKYRNDSKVMHIGGNNFQNGIHRGEKDASFYFSKFPHIWGWATWRRSWKYYTPDIGNWRTEKPNNMFSGMGFIEKLFWTENFTLVEKDLIDTWDYQWVYAIWKNFGICVTPNHNLVVNIGIGKDSTHTKTYNNVIARVRLEPINKITFPKIISIDTEADKYTSRKTFGASLQNLWKILLTVPYGIYKKI
jgi:hypothetical protein